MCEKTDGERCLLVKLQKSSNYYFVDRKNTVKEIEGMEKLPGEEFSYLLDGEFVRDGIQNTFLIFDALVV